MIKYCFIGVFLDYRSVLSIASLPQDAIELAFSSRPAPGIAFHSQVIEIQPGEEIVGLVFQDIEFVIMFASIGLLSGQDLNYVRTMADIWNQGISPPLDARIVKFARRDATDDATMFDPTAWQLPNRYGLRGFQAELETALADHADAVETSQYLFCPTTEKLSRLYKRMASNFASGELGVHFELLYEPASDTENLCYVRVES